MANLDLVKALAHEVVEHFLGKNPEIDASSVREELRRLLSTNQEAILEMASEDVNNFAEVFIAEKIDPRRYGAVLEQMSPQELVREAVRNAANTQQTRRSWQRRHAFFQDLGSAGFDITRRALISALLGAI